MMTKTTALPCLQAENVSWSFAQKEILHSMNLSLYPGEILGVIGPNGAGKSSLLKILAGVIKPDTGVLKLGANAYQNISPKHFAKTLGYLEQSASVHWPLLVSKVIQLGRLPFQGLSTVLSSTDQSAIDQAVLATGIKPLLDRVITTLSEGERMLVALTRVLATQTQIVLADEPVAALDPYHQLLIMELLQNYTRQQKYFSAVVVLHDLSLAARFCDRLILISQGSIVSAGTTEEVLSADNLSRYYKISADINFSKKTVTPLSRIN